MLIICIISNELIIAAGSIEKPQKLVIKLIIKLDPIDDPTVDVTV